MKRSSILMIAMALFCGMAAMAIAADDQPNGPPPKQNGGPGGGGPGGAGGPGGGPPPAGFHLIPRFAEEKLDLTDDQKKQIADLETEVKDKLAKILTPDQMKTLQSARPPRQGGQQGGRGQGQNGGQGGPPGGGQGGPPGGGQGNGGGPGKQPPPPSN